MRVSFSSGLQATILVFTPSQVRQHHQLVSFSNILSANNNIIVDDDDDDDVM